MLNTPNVHRSFMRERRATLAAIAALSPGRPQTHPELFAALNAENWQVLQLLAERDISAMSEHRSRLRSTISSTDTLTELSDSIVATWPTSRDNVRELLQLFEHLDDDELIADIAGRTGQQESEVVPTLQAAADRISTVDVDDIAATKFIGTQLVQLSRRQVRNLIEDVFAFSIARFNRSVGVLTSNDTRPTLEVLEELLDTTTRALHAALRSKDRLATASACETLSSTCRFVSAASLEHCAVLYGDPPDGTATEQRAHLDSQVRAAQLIRTTTVAWAAALHVGDLAAGQAVAPAYDRWTEAAAMSFASKADKGPNRSLRTLDRDATRYDGELIEITGVVTATNLARIGPNKVLSTLTITDPAGNTVEAVIPYIHVDSGGCVTGATVTVTGIWRAASSELDDRPGLEIDRHAWAALAKESFTDWMRHELSDIYEPVPHGLNMSWSWITGSNGAGNQIRYDLLAGRN